MNDVLYNSFVQAHLWTSTCTDVSNVTWTNLTLGKCYTYPDPQQSRMYSANLSIPGASFYIFESDWTCPEDGYLFVSEDLGGGCFGSPDGRGWLSFAVVADQTVSPTFNPSSSVSSAAVSTSAPNAQNGNVKRGVTDIVRKLRSQRWTYRRSSGTWCLYHYHSCSDFPFDSPS